MVYSHKQKRREKQQSARKAGRKFFIILKLRHVANQFAVTSCWRPKSEESFAGLLKTKICCVGEF
jgi:hypothetical protein